MLTLLPNNPSASSGGVSYSGSSGSFNNQLGSLSYKYESNGNAGTIARTKGDIGGPSYGLYQITVNSGHAQKFANQYGGALKGLTAGSAAFDQAWKKEAANNPDKFASAQHQYVMGTHYAPAANKFKEATGIDPSKAPKAIQDMIWSIGVQHGAGGASTIFKNAGVKVGMTWDSIINKVYNERSNVAKYFKSSPANIRQSVYNRFQREKNDALNMLKNQLT